MDERDPSMLRMAGPAEGERPRANAPNRARLWIDPAQEGLEVMALRMRSHVFRPHTHDTLMVGAVTAGCLGFERERRSWLAPAGSVSIVNPGELHNGRGEHGAELCYFSLYMPQALLAEAAGEDRATPAPYFRSGVVKDPELHASLSEIVRCVAQADSRMAREGAVIRSLRLLAGRHSQARPKWLRDTLDEPRAVRAAREMIEDRYADDLSVGEIASAVRLSRYHLMRVFREHAGLPLHAYQLQMRIERAKRMLAAGRAVVEVALDVGFADQSHFTKRFRSLVGLPPAAYQRCVLG